MAKSADRSLTLVMLFAAFVAMGCTETFPDDIDFKIISARMIEHEEGDRGNFLEIQFNQPLPRVGTYAIDVSLETKSGHKVKHELGFNRSDHGNFDPGPIIRRNVMLWGDTRRSMEEWRVLKEELVPGNLNYISIKLRNCSGRTYETECKRSTPVAEALFKENHPGV